MDVTAPETTTAPEPEVQKEAMKQMAQEVLAHAQDIISLNHLDSQSDFARLFFGTDEAKSILSATALQLEAFAKGEKPPSVDEFERQLLRKLTPEAKLELEMQKDLAARSISIWFRYSEVPRLDSHGLTIDFLQNLGFLNKNERIVTTNSSNVTLKDGRTFEVKHPIKPFIAECKPVSQGYEGEPRFTGFVIRYQAPQN